MVKRNGKRLDEYNSHDVRKEFTWLYSRKHHKDYVDRGFIGYDLKIIKQAIEKFYLVYITVFILILSLYPLNIFLRVSSLIIT